MICYASLLVTLLTLSGCSGGARTPWDDIDYSRISHGQAGENDPAYTAPTVIGCSDDDLYNCK